MRRAGPKAEQDGCPSVLKARSCLQRANLAFRPRVTILRQKKFCTTQKRPTKPFGKGYRQILKREDFHSFCQFQRLEAASSEVAKNWGAASRPRMERQWSSKKQPLHLAGKTRWHVGPLILSVITSYILRSSLRSRLTLLALAKQLINAFILLFMFVFSACGGNRTGNTSMPIWIAYFPRWLSCFKKMDCS